MNKMNISQAGIAFIASFEGCKLNAYQDTGGVWTIGFGHTGGVKKGQVITKKQAEDLLKKDVARYVAYANNLVKVELNQNQFDALVSFCYNCGPGNLEKCLIGHVNKKDFKTAALHFNDITRDKKGNVLPGLVRRREAERQLFVKPVTKPAKKVAESAVTMWKGRPLVKGQKGLLTIMKPINVWKRVGDKLEKVRVAKAGEELPVFEYDVNFYKAAGQYQIEGNLWITNMPGFIKYETPSKSLLEKANSQ